MNVTTALEIDEHTTFQVIAGSPGSGSTNPVRRLQFGVAGTNDSVRVDWNRLPHLSEGGTLPVSLRIGTLAAVPGVLHAYVITPASPPADPAFGPTPAAILESVARAFARLTLSRCDLPGALQGSIPASLYGEHPKMFEDFAIDGRHPKDYAEDGRHPKDHTATGQHPKVAVDAADPNVVNLNQIVYEYAACGYALGKLIAPERAETGLVLGALIGAMVHLGEH
jgi:hypothetical protein